MLRSSTKWLRLCTKDNLLCGFHGAGTWSPRGRDMVSYHPPHPSSHILSREETLLGCQSRKKLECWVFWRAKRKRPPQVCRFLSFHCFDTCCFCCDLWLHMLMAAPRLHIKISVLIPQVVMNCCAAVTAFYKADGNFETTEASEIYFR